MQDNNLNQIPPKEVMRQIVGRVRPRTHGRILSDSLLSRLPAVTRYKVIPKIYNPVLSSMGINLRSIPGTDIQRNTKTLKLNRYMRRTMLKIRKLIDKGRLSQAWNIAGRNIKKSKCFRSAAINRVLSGGYYNMAQSEVGKVSRTVSEIVEAEEKRIKLNRVYIPKPNGKGRPLGVPSREGRIYLHLITGFLYEFTKKDTPKNQHAYQPGKGTMTAWKSLLNTRAENMYETDLKNYFNEVSQGGILEKLSEKKLRKARTYIGELLKSIPTLPKIELVDETQYKLVSSTEDFQEKFGVVNVNLLDDSTKGREYAYVGEDTVSGTVINETRPNERSDSLRGLNYGITPGGVPQGTSLGPLLGIGVNKDYLQQEKSVGYADDQIFFPKSSDITIKDDPDRGVIHASEKCSGIKKDGKGLKDEFKFLGFTLNKEGVGKSSTRNGAKEPINEWILRMFTNEGLNLSRQLRFDVENSKAQTFTKEFLDDYKSKLLKIKHIDNGEVLRNLSSRQLMGFVMSCMNQSDWVNNHAAEDQEKALRNILGKMHKNALVKKYPKNTDSSGSIATLVSIVTKTMKSEAKKFASSERAKNLKKDNAEGKRRVKAMKLPKRSERNYDILKPEISGNNFFDITQRVSCLNFSEFKMKASKDTGSINYKDFNASNKPLG